MFVLRVFLPALFPHDVPRISYDSFLFGELMINTFLPYTTMCIIDNNVYGT